MTDITRRTQKRQAVVIMRQLGMSEHDVEFFRDHNVVKVHNGIKAQTICMRDEIEPYVKAYQKNTDSIVYAVLHSQTDFGEMYSLLIVPKFIDDWDKLIIPQGDGKYLVYAYVRNVDCDECSESGYVLVECRSGILRRIG